MYFLTHTTCIINTNSSKLAFDIFHVSMVMKGPQKRPLLSRARSRAAKPRDRPPHLSASDHRIPPR